MRRAPTPPIDPERARRAAREIVGARRYRPERVPRPLEGVLRWIGDRLAPIGDLFSGIGKFFSHGVGLALLVVLVAAGAVGIALLVARRGIGTTPIGDRRRRSAEDDLDPDVLLRAAAVAEARGNLDEALRLRFRAGLLQLDRVGAIRMRPSLTSGQVARALRLEEFDGLAATFDTVVYGGHAAAPGDVDAARVGWPRVLEAAAAR